jgi:hypothetical protein
VRYGHGRGSLDQNAVNFLRDDEETSRNLT